MAETGIPIETLALEAVNFIIISCCSCSRVRSGDGEWFEADDLLSVAPRSIVSHTVCPDCLARLYPRSYKRMVGAGMIAPDLIIR